MHYLIVDDHLLFAGGLALNRNTQRMERVDDQPDLILMDLNLPGISGLTLIRRLQQMSVFSPVMMISASESLADAGKALEHGALGYLPKSSPPEVLIKAIQDVLNGGTYLPEGWQELIESQKQELPAVPRDKPDGVSECRAQVGTTA